MLVTYWLRTRTVVRTLRWTRVCGPEPRYRGRAPLVLDAFGDAGPLGGVASGLAVLERALGVFLAVDLPHVPVALLSHLASLAGEADAVVPETERGPEPLCAVYTPACRAPVERALARGDLKMTSFWPEVRVRRVAPPELQRFGDPARLFQNVNAPEDYDQARVEPVR